MVGSRKLLGPTLDAVGSDFAKLYKIGRDKIIEKAKRKVPSFETDNKIANLRVVRDVFWNGSFNNSDIAAEYFGGILAASRTKDGEDDSMIYYLDIIKSFSSKQLTLHYLIYRAINELLVVSPDKKNINLGQSSNMGQMKFYTEIIELVRGFDIDLSQDFVALYSKGLVSQWNTPVKVKINDRELDIPFVEITPTTLGFQLYAAACNEIQCWRTTSIKLLEPLPEIATLSIKTFDKNSLVKT